MRLHGKRVKPAKLMEAFLALCEKYCIEEISCSITLKDILLPDITLQGEMEHYGTAIRKPNFRTKKKRR